MSTAGANTGLDVDLATLTYTGEYRYVPEYLAACGWKTVERKVADLFGAHWDGQPVARRPRGRGDHPGYVTATSSAHG